MSGTVSGQQLADLIPDAYWEYDVRRRDGSLATRIDCLQGAVAARYGMVSGLVTRGRIRYFTLLVPKAALVRVLRMDPARPGELTRKRPSDLQWPPRLDRAKSGQCGGLKRIHLRPAA